jgi:hypothetical protein
MTKPVWLNGTTWSSKNVTSAYGPGLPSSYGDPTNTFAEPNGWYTITSASIPSIVSVPFVQSETPIYGTVVSVPSFTTYDLPRTKIEIASEIIKDLGELAMYTREKEKVNRRIKRIIRYFIGILADAIEE